MEQKEKNISEIDIINLLTTILKRWRYLARFAVAGGFIGIIVAFSIPKEFASTVILAPEFSSGLSGLSGSLSDLASSFGVNIGNSKSSVDAIYPDLYPDIFESTEFIQSLYDIPVRLEKDTTTRTYLHHKIKEGRIAWWNYPKVWLMEKLKPAEPLPGQGEDKVDPYAMNRTQWDIYKGIESSIDCFVDKKTSVISISVTDQDPLVAAIVADTLQLRLQEYVTNYRTSKARIDVEHYRQLVAQAKDAYDKVRKLFVSQSDSHFDAILMAVTSKTEDLENDMQLKYNVYTQSMAQLKLAEAKLQERTPAFTIIQPAKVNPKPVSTPRIVILFIWVFLSVMAGAAVILYQEYKKKPA
jgi:uncharacterized protein involved in exopolysaccharide biosynthesis